MRELALRYVLSQPEISSAIIGFGEIEHVLEAVRTTQREPLSSAELLQVEAVRNSVADP